MAKTAEKTITRKIELPCPVCGDDMRWIKYANKNIMVKFCPKCDKMFDRRDKEYKGVSDA